MSIGTADFVLECALSHLGDGETSEHCPGPFVDMLRCGDASTTQWSTEFAAYCLERGGAVKKVTPNARRGAKRMARHLGRVGVGTLVEYPVIHMLRGDVVCWNATDKPTDYRGFLALVDCYDPSTGIVAVVMGAVAPLARRPGPGSRTVQRLVMHADGGAAWTRLLHSVHRPNYARSSTCPV